MSFIIITSLLFLTGALLEFGMDYAFHKPEGAEWFSRKVRKAMGLWVAGGVSAILPPTALNFYVISELGSIPGVICSAAAIFVHMQLLADVYPWKAAEDAVRAVFLSKFTAFHLLSATLVWHFLI